MRPRATASGPVSTRLVLRILFAVACASPVATSHGTDMTAGLRNLEKHRDWVSLDIQLPSLGVFLAARAATDDKKHDATLNVTFFPNETRCGGMVELLFKRAFPAEKDETSNVSAKIVFDGEEPRSFPVEIHLFGGDPFLFVSFPKDFPLSALTRHRAMRAEVAEWGSADLSLAGYAAAGARGVAVQPRGAG